MLTYHFRMAKSEQLQIRVTPEQKSSLKRLARAAGLDVSEYVLARALPPARLRLASILGVLSRDDDRRYAFAELNDFLAALPAGGFGDAVAAADVSGLSPYVKNYVAAMVELAAKQKRVPPPAWVRDVEPLTEPHFATPMRGLRLHLLQSAPIPFKRRNIFVDTSIGGRV